MFIIFLRIALLFAICNCYPMHDLVFHDDLTELDLFKAAQTGDLELLKKAIANGADVNKKKPQDCETALAMAVTNGNIEIAEYLLGCKAHPNDVISYYNYSPDKYRVDFSKNIKAWNNLIKQAIDKGANVNLFTRCDGYPLINMAYWMGNIDLVKCLLESKADPNGARHIRFSPANVPRDAWNFEEPEKIEAKFKAITLCIEHSVNIDSGPLFQWLTCESKEYANKFEQLYKKHNIDIGKCLNECAWLFIVACGSDRVKVQRVFELAKIYGGLECNYYIEGEPDAITRAKDSDAQEIIAEFQKFADEHANLIMRITKFPRPVAWFVMRYILGEVPMLHEVAKSGREARCRCVLQ